VIYDDYPTHQSKNSHQLMEYFDSKRIDVVIWGVAMVIPYYRKITKLLYKKSIKQIAIFHSLAIGKSFKERIIEQFVSMSLKSIDDLVFVSEYTESSWSKKYRSIRKHANHYVIYNPSSLNETDTIRSTSHRIGFVGRFSDEKQPELFAQLSLNDDKNKYIAWGDGPLRENLSKTYSNVAFKGQSSDQREIYDSIDILVMTSKFENCPMVILEAWKYGIPCVAPNVGGIPEIITSGRNGILYDNYSIETIKSCIIQIQTNYRNYSENCSKDIKKYSYESQYRLWLELLNNKKK
jgi:glycosyltransferase involved in cell wall biosynthesis